MFEESLVESTPLLHTHNRVPALLSLAAQITAVALILALPLLHPEILPATRLLPAALTAPQPVQPPPIHLKPIPVTTSVSAPETPGTAYAAPRSDLLHPTGAAVDAPALGIVNLGLRNSSLPPGIDAAPGNPHITVAEPAAKSSSAPTRLSSGVSAGLLLAPIRPQYPSIALTTRTEGTVIVDAIISRSGSSAHVLSGPTLLQSAALAAVRQARYRPFLLNGQPTEVRTTITINFKLGN